MGKESFMKKASDYEVKSKKKIEAKPQPSIKPNMKKRSLFLSGDSMNQEECTSPNGD